MHVANRNNLIKCTRCDAIYDRTVKWRRGYYHGTSNQFTQTSTVKENTCPICGKENKMKLGEKLKQTLDRLDQAKITKLEEQAAADLAKIERERKDIADWLESVKKRFVEQINDDRVPMKKVENYERREWIKSATKGDAAHQDLWNGFQQFWKSEGLEIVSNESHDGMGMKSWTTITLQVLPPRVRASADIGVYNG